MASWHAGKRVAIRRVVRRGNCGSIPGEFLQSNRSRTYIASPRVRPHVTRAEGFVPVGEASQGMPAVVAVLLVFNALQLCPAATASRFSVSVIAEGWVVEV